MAWTTSARSTGKSARWIASPIARACTMAAVTPARYFIAAAIVLLLGASALRQGMDAMSYGGSSNAPYATAMGVWGVLRVRLAPGGPILLPAPRPLPPR